MSFPSASPGINGLTSCWISNILDFVWSEDPWGHKTLAKIQKSDMVCVFKAVWKKSLNTASVACTSTKMLVMCYSESTNMLPPSVLEIPGWLWEVHCTGSLKATISLIVAWLVRKTRWHPDALWSLSTWQLFYKAVILLLCFCRIADIFTFSLI